MSTGIYLDNNATTALDERVLEAMLPVLRHAGNASSTHQPGQHARRLVENARSQVADLASVSTQEVIFTGGATEANNLAVRGATMAALADRMCGRDEVVTCATEHLSVLECVMSLRSLGVFVTVISVDEFGVIDLDQLRAGVSERTALVTVMAANSETGVLAPLQNVVEIAHDVGALVHTDATQLMAWGGTDLDSIGVDLLSLSAHKMHGPQGVGALIARRSVQRVLEPIVHGGGHERGLRSGTMNTAGVVGFGAAAGLAVAEGAAAADQVRGRRDRLEGELRRHVGSDALALNGHRTLRTPGTLNVSILDVDAEVVLAATPQVAMSTGSACSAGVPGPSHVLRAMGLPAQRCDTAIRLSLSRDTTDRDVDTAAAAIGRTVRTARERLSLAGAR